MNQRDYKFRAWDNKKKEWLLGYEMPNLGGFSLFGEMVLMGAWANVLNDYFLHHHGSKIDDLIVMQFTGLKDKNGKEIYEGDTVKSDIGEIANVEWSNCHYWFVRRDRDKKQIITMFEPYMIDGEVKLEVIGNIYENPELSTLLT
jgi:uncharacterized phage protein (TIGR01671 family)